ncbi:hypothetical protein HKX23_17845 [Sulfitobacter sp. KE29]|uniref:hypothetical protein n=1 Tax=unclassified Sulfitobacter TaxID=196795 RepID=UPI0023E34E0A|nr:MULTISPECIES: hypothetical protein [unclassified Sulfitobacter]MDF3420220.1 hypothetical protein [Sulfitobacter sp. Ks38]MDF3427701.1 hypothetical protein [Sulfitobacter sp. KE29]MDF3431287.1 hypothetical protein [Sulfitobacter sp. S46]MDF3446033.1 hypothetical protein [Sulfitobacter sp. KE31]MDF3550065.1 hypothetical protein [Sulfitobacter sp. KE28]|tara:strand:- start:566 stop:769 length:204 start_codon:yes stop_codon:yes gene_type:complete
MIGKLKNSRTGKRLYRFSRRPAVGWPIRSLARFLQSEHFQPSHFYPANRAHNRRVSEQLERFEAALK